MTTVTSYPARARWTGAEKNLFRFFLIFFGLYMAPWPLNSLPFTDELFDWVNEVWNWLIVNTGSRVLHLPYPITVRPNGSGDTTWNYVQLFLMFIGGLLGAIIWGIADRERPDYCRAAYWLSVAVSFYLGLVMCSYGFYKLFKVQFPAPGIFRLVETYGQSTPMGLAWTFLGFSKGYNYYMGFAEVFGGLLVLFRNTRTFGALFCLTVATNIMAINYFFDVPVKIFSTMLFLMSGYIAAPNLHRLWSFFVENKAAALHVPGFSFVAPWKKWSLVAAKYAFLLYSLYGLITGPLERQQKYGDDAPKPKWYGYYNVETFIKNGVTLPPLQTDTVRWNKVILYGNNYGSVKRMDDSALAFTLELDSARHQFNLIQRDDATWNYSFSYQEGPAGAMTWQGGRNGDSISITLKKIDIGSQPLMNRGFHWINEYPLNR